MTSWLPDSFSICKRITPDTPIEYHQMDDLRFGPATAVLLPKQMRASRQMAAMVAKKEGAKDPLAPIALAAKKEGVTVSEAGIVLKRALVDLQAANAKHIEDGVNSLKKEGATAFVTEIVKNMTAPPSPLETDMLFAAGVETDDKYEVKIVLQGNDIAKKIAAQYGIPAIKTVREAMASKYWPLLREGIEDEIAGKLANEA